MRGWFAPDVYKPKAVVIHVIGGGTVTLEPGQITMGLPKKRLETMFGVFPPVGRN
jgi:hypothetical protein